MTGTMEQFFPWLDSISWFKFTMFDGDSSSWWFKFTMFDGFEWSKPVFFSTGRDAMAPIWLVVGGEQTGGIVVRAGAA